ncbi:MAG: hypothetical protein HKN68_21460, partial [Saprospiraceae bacterium]|nr:hypothetical protein [Saprospiraceae bacterium]
MRAIIRSVLFIIIVANVNSHIYCQPDLIIIDNYNIKDNVKIDKSRPFQLYFLVTNIGDPTTSIETDARLFQGMAPPIGFPAPGNPPVIGTNLTGYVAGPIVDLSSGNIGPGELDVFIAGNGEINIDGNNFTTRPIILTNGSGSLFKEIRFPANRQVIQAGDIRPIQIFVRNESLINPVCNLEIQTSILQNNDPLFFSLEEVNPSELGPGESTLITLGPLPTELTPGEYSINMFNISLTDDQSFPPGESTFTIVEDCQADVATESLTIPGVNISCVPNSESIQIEGEVSIESLCTNEPIGFEVFVEDSEGTRIYEDISNIEIDGTTYTLFKDIPPPDGYSGDATLNLEVRMENESIENLGNNKITIPITYTDASFDFGIVSAAIPGGGITRNETFSIDLTLENFNLCNNTEEIDLSLIALVGDEILLEGVYPLPPDNDLGPGAQGSFTIDGLVITSTTASDQVTIEISHTNELDNNPENDFYSFNADYICPSNIGIVGVNIDPNECVQPGQSIGVELNNPDGCSVNGLVTSFEYTRGGSTTTIEVPIDIQGGSTSTATYTVPELDLDFEELGSLRFEITDPRNTGDPTSFETPVVFSRDGLSRLELMDLILQDPIPSNNIIDVEALIRNISQCYDAPSAEVQLELRNDDVLVNVFGPLVNSIQPGQTSTYTFNDVDIGSDHSDLSFCVNTRVRPEDEFISTCYTLDCIPDLVAKNLVLEPNNCYRDNGPQLIEVVVENTASCQSEDAQILVTIDNATPLSFDVGKIEANSTKSFNLDIAPGLPDKENEKVPILYEIVTSRDLDLSNNISSVELIKIKPKDLNPDGKIDNVEIDQVSWELGSILTGVITASNVDECDAFVQPNILMILEIVGVGYDSSVIAGIPDIPPNTTGQEINFEFQTNSFVTGGPGILTFELFNVVGDQDVNPDDNFFTTEIEAICATELSILSAFVVGDETCSPIGSQDTLCINIANIGMCDTEGLTLQITYTTPDGSILPTVEQLEEIGAVSQKTYKIPIEPASGL